MLAALTPDERVLVRDGLTFAVFQAFVVGSPPKQGVRVQEKPQGDSPENPDAISSGSGSSKSAWIRTFPFRPPGRRGLGFSGTSLATGLPARARMISSPSATHSSRRERCVFASWILTVFIKVNNHRLEGGGFKGCQLEIDCRREEARHPGSLCTPLPSRPLCFLNSPPDILGPRSAGPKTSSSGEQTPEGVLGSLFLLATARSYSRSWCGR